MPRINKLLKLFHHTGGFCCFCCVWSWSYWKHSCAVMQLYQIREKVAEHVAAEGGKDAVAKVSRQHTQHQHLSYFEA